MWIMLSDAFLSIVKKDCPPGFLLVRARRAGDIESVFGRQVKTERTTDADYLWRALLPARCVAEKIAEQVEEIDYDNFKNTVKDDKLHGAYIKVWSAMAATQSPAPYSKPYRPPTRAKRKGVRA